MLTDRHRLRRNLQALKQQTAPDAKRLAQLAQQMATSADRYQTRLSNIPKPKLDADLPVIARREEIAKAIAYNQVIILCGETGSGKTTQLPQICLDLGRGVSGLIGHTQPRRIAARTVATRIAEELDSSIGETVG
ncbi:MAG: ATP-dependent RNA helicase HrpA, partial [Methylophaga sp.]